jgi:ribokinase
MSGRVIVVGSVNVDQVITLDQMPATGETVIGGRYEQHHGGKGGNQAVAAARLGAAVVFVGAVGDDDLGRSAREALAAEGIDLSRLFVLDGEPTGATHEALRLGRIAGATTILNPAPAGGLARPTLDLADILTPNRGELAILAGADGKPAKLAKRLLDTAGGQRSVLVSLGAEGALLVRPAGTTAIPALSVDAVDTVGAGDALNGALAAGLATGQDLEAAARRAVGAAALAVTKAGARAGMPTASELKRALARA